MNAEFRMLNAEWRGENGACRRSGIHHSSLILHHSRHHSRRRGLSLLEVLVSMGVLALGMLGVAMLIPIGKFAMTETEKSDRTGMCGRAGLRDVKVRKLLNPDPTAAGWTMTPLDTVNVAVIDPLGLANGLNGTNAKYVGGTTSGPCFMQRISLTGVNAENVFRWQDDLNFVAAKDSTSPSNGDRPIPGGGGYIGNFSWFFTVAGSPADYQPGTPPALPTGTPWLQRKLFSVSIVVCYKRDFAVAPAGDSRNPDPEGEQSWPVTYTPPTNPSTSNGFTGFGLGGGTIQLDTTNKPLDADGNHPINRVKEDQWVMLVGLDATNNPIVGNWYRVVGVGRDLSQTSPPVNMLSLVGPDWPGCQYDSAGNAIIQKVNLVVVNGVTGVYTRTVELDNDATWSR